MANDKIFAIQREDYSVKLLGTVRTKSQREGGNKTFRMDKSGSRKSDTNITKNNKTKVSIHKIN